MKPSRRAAIALAAAASVLLLAGCASSDPPPVGLSDAQRAAASQSILNQRWAQVSDGVPGFAQPKAARVRYTTSLDSTTTIAACLRKSGYPKTIATSSGVANVALTPPEAYPFTVAEFRCEEKYPEDPVDFGFMSAAQQEFLYRYWNDQAVPCLRAQGARVADLPDLGVPGVTSPPVIDLDPFVTVRPPSGASLGLLEARCPQFPAALYQR